MEKYRSYIGMFIIAIKVNLSKLYALRLNM